MRVPFIVLLTFAFALAGCTDPDDSMGDDPSDGDGGGDAGGTMPAGEAEPKTHHISIEGFAFSDSDLSITEGDTVIWTNNDSVAHTVESTDGEEFDSGNIAVGATFSHTFEEAGTFDYVCGYHASMTGTITVTSLAAS